MPHPSMRHIALVMAVVTLLTVGTVLIVALSARAGTAVIFIEDFESGYLGPQWNVTDTTPASGLDYWGASNYRARSGNYSAWCAQVGTQQIGGQNNTAVRQYDDNMDADLVVNLRVNGFTSLTLNFYYWVRTESGGGDWIQAWYEAGGSQFNIFSNVGGTGNKWELASVSVPNNVERLIIRFHSDSANHGFEGAYVDDVVLYGVEDVPPVSNVSTLPTYANTVPYAVPYAAQDNANASGVAYVELWYRQATSGSFTLYNTTENPLGRWTTPTIPFDATLAFGDGYYEFYTVAVDAAGNAETPPAGPDASITIDTTPPTLVLTSPAQGGWWNSSVTVTWQGSDGLSGLNRYETSIDSSPFTSNGLVSSQQYAGLQDGAHVVVVRAYDNAGSMTEISVSFDVDTTAPTVSISAPYPDEVIRADEFTFSWTGMDATSGLDHYEIWLDNGTRMVTSETQITIQGLTSGQHTFHAVAIDRAGNMRESVVTFTVAAPSVIGFDFAWLFWLILAIILALVIIFLLLWWKRKRDEKEELKALEQGRSTDSIRPPSAESREGEPPLT